MSTFCGSIGLTDTGGSVLAGSTPHYHFDVLRKKLTPEEDFIPCLYIIRKCVIKWDCQNIYETLPTSLRVRCASIQDTVCRYKIRLLNVQRHGSTSRNDSVEHFLEENR